MQMTDLLNAAYCNSPKAYKKLPNTLEETKVIRNNTEGPSLDQQKRQKTTGKSHSSFTVTDSKPGCVLMLSQFNISINTLEKGEKGEQQNLQRLLGITETTADSEELQKDSIK